MSDDGKAGLRERLRLAAVPIPTWTAEIAYAVRLDDVLAVVAAWLRDEAARVRQATDGLLTWEAVDELRRADVMAALADILDPKETDR